MINKSPNKGAIIIFLFSLFLVSDSNADPQKATPSLRQYFVEKEHIPPNRDWTVTYDIKSPSAEVVECRQTQEGSTLALVQWTNNSINQSEEYNLTDRRLMMTIVSGKDVFPFRLVPILHTYPLSEEHPEQKGTYTTYEYFHNCLDGRAATGIRFILQLDDLAAHDYHPINGDATGKITFTNKDKRYDLVVSCAYVPTPVIKQELKKLGVKFLSI